MAGNDLDYKFPDEQEVDLKEGGELEIEIEDDTPEEDRGRTPSDPEKVKQLEVEVDDLDKYSKDAKDKLIRMKRVWNDERRARETAEREQHEAIEAARRLYAENQRIRELVNSRAAEYQEVMKETTEIQLKAAKKEFKDAYEAGDSDAMAEAQEKMTRLQVELDGVKKGKLERSLQDDFGGVQTPQQEQYVPQPAPQVARPDDRVMEWQEENPWFGQDRVMTATALGIHEDLRDKGIEIGSEDYYAKLDKTMRKRFPDYFEGDEPVEPKADKPKAKPATVVASAARSTAPKRVRLKQSQVAIAKKLGLTPEQYVRELLKLEA
jgi:hypothetical protein